MKKVRSHRRIFMLCALGVLPLAVMAGLGPTTAMAQEDLVVPGVNIELQATDEPGQVTVVLEIFLLLTVLSVAPALLIMVTSFTRIIIVMSLLRRAIGTQQMPPNQVLVGISLFLTLFIMQPVWTHIYDNAFQPYVEKKVSLQEGIQKSAAPLREFMLRQTREKDLALFVELSRSQRPLNADDISITVLIPAFIISEIQTAFQIGLLIFVPFLVIDMVVASVLLSMGMMMLPPIMISLPFKLMLFVLADGWFLVVGSMVKSFR